MPDTVQTLIDEVTQEGGFEATDVQALRWLNRRHRFIVAQSRSLRDRVQVGPTVAGQEFYAVSNVVETYNVEVGGVPYAKARRPDVYGYSQGTLLWTGPTGAGFVVEDVDESGVQGFTLIPPPDSAGTAITIWAAVPPADLAAADPASALKIDSDCYDGLVSGAIATGLLRIEQRPDLAAPHEQIFAATVEMMRQRVKRRYNTSGPAQIRVVGVNA